MTLINLVKQFRESNINFSIQPHLNLMGFAYNASGSMRAIGVHKQDGIDTCLLRYTILPIVLDLWILFQFQKTQPKLQSKVCILENNLS